MVKTESREIDGMTVTCTQFGAMRASALLHRLMRVAAPVLTALGTGLRLTTNVVALAAPMTALATSMSTDEFHALLKDLLAATTVEKDGKQWPLTDLKHIDAVFSGSLFAMYAAAVFAAEVNFGPLFAAVSKSLPDNDTDQNVNPENPSD